MSKYPEDKPFGEWTPEQQREFKIAVFIDRRKYEVRSTLHEEWVEGDATGYKNQELIMPVFYRLAPEPEPEIPDSIDWSHVHPDYIKLINRHGLVTLIDDRGNEIGAFGFASYKLGNMKSCTVYRPGFEPKGEK